MVETIKGSFDHVDILCNNAGASFGVPNTVLSYDEAAWIKTIDVNLFSVFRISRAVIPLMAGKPAAIINTASRAGKVPPIFNSAYAVAKAGVIMLTKTMAKELGGTVSGSMRSARGKSPQIWKSGVSGWKRHFSAQRLRSGKRKCARPFPWDISVRPVKQRIWSSFWRPTLRATLPDRPSISMVASAWNYNKQYFVIRRIYHG